MVLSGRLERCGENRPLKCRFWANVSVTQAETALGGLLVMPALMRPLTSGGVMPKGNDHALVVMAALADPLRKLREAGSVAVPSDDLAVQAVTGCLNARTGQWRATKPADETAGLLWQLVKFHRSGGSLYGWPWCCWAGNRPLRQPGSGFSPDGIRSRAGGCGKRANAQVSPNAACPGSVAVVRVAVASACAWE